MAHNTLYYYGNRAERESRTDMEFARAMGRDASRTEIENGYVLRVSHKVYKGN